ncbi:MAG: LysR family transcriptional regulator [Desulfobacterales bacterium]|nr:MAG: LysR family transcriptional regulator [Desulfobacterales bacterium]
MNLWQLKIFCNVVQLGGFSKAGKVVHLSQPTVSSHIKDLENHFGCNLIDRLGKKAVPTKAGELLYKYATQLLALADETETAMAEFQGKIKGRLVVGGSTIPGEYILPKLIGAFTKDYPEVKISLFIGDTQQVVGDILSGVLELGIVGAISSDKNIWQETLIEDDLRLIVPADHKWGNQKNIHLSDIFEEPFIMREHGSGTLKSIRLRLSDTGYSPEDLNMVAEMGSTAAVIQGIKSKVGISILSVIAVKEELQAKTLRSLTIKGLNLKRHFYMTTHRRRSLSPICNAFIKYLKKTVNTYF